MFVERFRLGATPHPIFNPVRSALTLANTRELHAKSFPNTEVTRLTKSESLRSLQCLGQEYYFHVASRFLPGPFHPPGD